MSDFEAVRSTTIDADPARVHNLVDDFHEWPRWSPWEGLDPDLQRSYTGPDAGVGAHYAWVGNRKAGAGSMEITASSPGAILIDLDFLKPFENRNKVTFELTATGAGTDVTWRMAGTTQGLWALVSKVFSMDKVVGKDFERGLAQLKQAAEA